MSDTNKSGEISRRLSNAEEIINLLFKLPSPNTTLILEKKINQFEELIALYSDQPYAKDLVDEARAKVVSMWLRIYNSASLPQKASSESEGFCHMISNFKDKKENSGSKSDLKSEGFTPSNKIEQTLKTDETCSFKNLLTLPKQSLIPNAHSFGNWRSQLVHSFKSSLVDLEVIESANVEAIKDLLRKIARVKSELARYPKDTQLRFNIFNIAFNKLSLTMREQFLSIYGPVPNGINLDNLIAFLQIEIVQQHTKMISLMKSKNHFYLKTTTQPNDSFSSMAPCPENSFQFCKYCKSHDHSRDACPNAEKVLCFRCFENGHSKRNCPFGRY